MFLLVLRRAFMLPITVVLAMLVLATGHAHAQSVDPGAIAAAISLLLPPPYAGWFADALAVAALVSLAARLITLLLRPPSSSAPLWLQRSYHVVTLVALDLGWARNVVVAGMDPGLQRALRIADQVKLSPAVDGPVTAAPGAPAEAPASDVDTMKVLRSVFLAATAGAALLGLAACQNTPSGATLTATAPMTASTASRDLTLAQTAISDGQLACQVGPTAFAMMVPGGAAILAKGAAASAVSSICGAVGGAAVALQNVGVTSGSVPTITFSLPPSISVPLKAPSATS